MRYVSSLAISERKIFIVTCRADREKEATIMTKIMMIIIMKKRDEKRVERRDEMRWEKGIVEGGAPEEGYQLKSSLRSAIFFVRLCFSMLRGLSSYRLGPIFARFPLANGVFTHSHAHTHKHRHECGQHICEERFELTECRTAPKGIDACTWRSTRRVRRDKGNPSYYYLSHSLSRSFSGS